MRPAGFFLVTVALVGSVASDALALQFQTRSGLDCVPHGNPGPDWASFGTTIFGPANHTPVVRTLQCPMGFNDMVATTNDFVVAWAGYDRSPTAAVTGTFCSYSPIGSSGDCDNDNSGIAFTGSFTRMFPWGVQNVPTPGYFVLTVTLPGAYGQNVSHLSYYVISQQL